MPNTLVDSNIYLRLYELGGGFQKLLPALKNLAESIFVTSKIVNEVLRNRVDAAIRTRQEHLRSLGNGQSRLPEVIACELGERREDLEKRYADIKHLREALNEHAREQVKMVSEGTDTLSQALDELFDRAQPPSETQLEHARLRRELGTPPGKPGDPLGDQLTWEQFIDQVDPSSEVVIVTNDRDYASAWDKDLFLKPNLARELKKLGVGKALVFNSLAGALPAIKTVARSTVVIPSASDLKEVAEREALTWPHSRYSIFADPTDCPRCQSTRIALVPKPSQFGGWGYHLFCEACGFHEDTGIPYDD